MKKLYLAFNAVKVEKENEIRKKSMGPNENIETTYKKLHTKNLRYKGKIG